jgi:hypothetical protein
MGSNSRTWPGPACQLFSSGLFPWGNTTLLPIRKPPRGPRRRPNRATNLSSYYRISRPPLQPPSGWRRRARCDPTGHRRCHGNFPDEFDCPRRGLSSAVNQPKTGAGTMPPDGFAPACRCHPTALQSKRSPRTRSLAALVLGVSPNRESHPMVECATAEDTRRALRMYGDMH